MLDILAGAAASWGVLMAVAPLLQVRRMRQTGSSADLSVGYFAVLQPGFLLWLCYGTAIQNAALIVANSAALAFGIITIALALRLQHSGAPSRRRQTR